MQTIFEGISVLLDLLAVHGTAFVISANLETRLAHICKHYTNLLSLVGHGLLVGVKPSVPRLGVVKIFSGAWVWIAKCVRGIAHASKCREAAALDGDGLRHVRVGLGLAELARLEGLPDEFGLASGDRDPRPWRGSAFCT